MKLSDLSPEVIERIKKYEYDRIIEKHEGPETWKWSLKHFELIEMNGYTLLLPIYPENRLNITMLRCIVSQDGRTLLFYLKDTTYVKNPEDERFYAGFVAVCEKFPNENFYIATLYHEWYITENPELA